jgi:hypothetical protein
LQLKNWVRAKISVYPAVEIPEWTLEFDVLKPTVPGDVGARARHLIRDACRACFASTRCSELLTHRAEFCACDEQ